MPVHELAVRPAPFTGESLTSYARRLAEANHTSLTQLLGHYPAPTKLRYGDPCVIERIHKLTGVQPAQLEQMCHPIVARAKGSRIGFLGIRTNQPAICHKCHAEDGIRRLEWDYPLVNICVYCNGLLRAKSGPEDHDVPSRWLLNDLQDVRDIVVYNLAATPAIRRRLELLIRMGNIVAANMSHTWPSSRFPVVRDAARREATALRTDPARRLVAAPPSPDLVLLTIATCWDLTAEPDTAEKFLRQRHRQAHNRDEARVRRIEEGRAEVAAWIEAMAARRNGRPRP